jgi:hypothetical protein
MDRDDVVLELDGHEVKFSNPDIDLDEALGRTRTTSRSRTARPHRLGAQPRRDHARRKF